MAVKVTRKLTQRCVDGADYDGVAKELGLDPHLARKSNKRLLIWDGQLPGYGLSLTPKGSKSFCWFHKVDGKSRKLTVGNTTQVTANRARDLVLEAMQQVREGEDPTHEAKQGKEQVLTVSEAFEKFLAVPKRDGSERAPATVYAYRKDFRRFVAPIIGNKPITAVGQAACNQVLDAALEGTDKQHVAVGPRKTQHNRARAMLRALLSWCWERELIDAVPRMGRRYAEVKRTPFATRADIIELSGALGAYAEEINHRPHVVAALRMLIYTGARTSEVINIQWSDVNWDEGEIRLQQYKGSTHANAKTRVIIITPQVAQILEQAKKWKKNGNPYVFPGRYKGPYKSLRKDWIFFREKYLGGRDLRKHDLRHIAGSAALNEGGMSTEAVGSVLGHKNKQTTERYARVQSDSHRRASHQLSKTLDELMGGRS